MICTTHNYNNCGNILTIPKGNPFRVSLCPQRIAPAQRSASFADITDLSVRLTRQNWYGQDAVYELTEEGDIIIQVPATLKCTTYGLELSGTYQGNPWRWKDCSVFCVTECNPCSNMQGFESFGVETYYIYDDIIPTYDKDNEALVLNTHAHAWVDDEGALHLRESDSVSIETIKNTLIIRQYGRTGENIEGRCGRPSREYHR